MATDASSPPDSVVRQPHPYLHEPLLYITGLPPHIRDEDLAAAFQTCAPFRPQIPRDPSAKLLSGTIEFKFMEKGAPALRCRLTLSCEPRADYQSSGEGPCDAAVASDTRAAAASAPRAVTVPVDHPADAPTTAVCFTTPREASSIRLHRLAAV